MCLTVRKKERDQVGLVFSFHCKFRICNLRPAAPQPLITVILIINVNLEIYATSLVKLRIAK